MPSNPETKVLTPEEFAEQFAGSWGVEPSELRRFVQLLTARDEQLRSMMRKALIKSAIPLEALRLFSDKDREHNYKSSGRRVGFLTTEIYDAIVEATDAIRALLLDSPT
jgi:hypothetical protein